MTKRDCIKQWKTNNDDMGLNEVMEKLAKETGATLIKQSESREQCFAERIFFERMLKDINHGMCEDKIDATIQRAVMIAKKLNKAIYG